MYHRDFPPLQRVSKKALEGLPGGDLGKSGAACPHAPLTASRVCSPVPAPAYLLVAPEASFAKARCISPWTARAATLRPCPFLVLANACPPPGAGAERRDPSSCLSSP